MTVNELVRNVMDQLDEFLTDDSVVHFDVAIYSRMSDRMAHVIGYQTPASPHRIEFSVSRRQSKRQEA